jgi:NAD(P)H dehydrogenase (quinone)
MFTQNLLSVWSIEGGLYSVYTSKAIGFTALEDVAEAATSVSIKLEIVGST